MGDHSVLDIDDQERRRRFLQRLLNDVNALATMLDKGLFETGITRIGAEQEFCLVDASWRPAPVNLAVLERVADDHFTTELARFNLEINLDPLEFTAACFTTMEQQLRALLAKAVEAAREVEAHVLLTGIMPTIRNADLIMDKLTPNPRYKALNDAIYKMRGGDFEFHIKGTDQLITKHNSILFEACNTSFQVHLQVAPQDYARVYNWAQAITGPVLAAATNSAMLLGKRLWHETRIALFQQSIDMRDSSNHVRYSQPRVSFGNRWLNDSVIELFREDIARYKLLLTDAKEEDSLAKLQQDIIPELYALRLHNGTIYKWNRPCYGVADGVAHLRIENRVFPAGPTVEDEIANAAFWLGCVHGLPDEYHHIAERMDFDDAATNFVRAARMGLNTQFAWIDGQIIPSHELLLKELLPIARQGLINAAVAQKDIDRYLGIIEERVRTRRTGSQWQLDSFNRLKNSNSRDDTVVALTAGMYARQHSGKPVHEWSLAEEREGGSWLNSYKTVEQVMATDLFTVHEHDPLDLVINIMEWRHIRHIPVESESGNIVGLVSSRQLISLFTKSGKEEFSRLSAKDVMVRNPVTVTPETSTAEALTLMRKHAIGSLPVTRDAKLVGIITETDFIAITERIFEELVDEPDDYSTQQSPSGEHSGKP